MSWSRTFPGVALIVTLCLAFASPAQAEGMIGRWRGLGLQVGREGVQTTWDVRLTIRADIMSRIEYPSLGCKGELDELSRTAQMIEFRERIISGDCISGGRVVATLRDGRLSWFWYKAGSGADASAVLYRDAGVS